MNENEGPIVSEIPQWVLESGLLDVWTGLMEHPVWMLAVVVIGVLIALVGRGSAFVTMLGYLVAAAGLWTLVGGVVVLDGGMEQLGVTLVGLWIIASAVITSRMTTCRS
ncbi:hypothetical protein Bra3105_18260 [Brachybacterium halotolerans subsp. kimchii]|uniref:hypothetical protein n=1 Tax=Brachybacterium halotolerans TaxID=2795215 RepID=UPI001E657ED9|nr:hypothetical protein [Brachybacterium halotolerans]UEJ82742.1 hypothetical protein Bra3105_18260 [Brachybacterium halotolerans subsp. kimchii]